MKNIKIEQLKTNAGNPASNQFIGYTEDGKFFQSYDSLIATMNYSNKELALYPDWDYSNTTRKYLYQFFRTCGIAISNKKDVLQAIKDGEISTRFATYKIKEC